MTPTQNSQFTHLTKLILFFYRKSYSARVNVYGIPFIREMTKITGVSGTDLIIKCPVAGYPIDKIQWERGKLDLHGRDDYKFFISISFPTVYSDGQVLPVNRRQRAYNNGTLIIEQLQRTEDAGTYTCMAQNKQKQNSRRNVEIQILVPPKIQPIQEMTNLLREGMRAAMTCQILEGDLPVSFRWERNGKQILGTGIEVIRRVDEYSTSLVIEKITSDYSGNYTCISSNVAGMEKFTVPLTVNVPPKWVVEPKDMSIQSNQDILLNCQADGYPVPTITWKKAIGNTPGEYKDFLYEPDTLLMANGSLHFKKITKTSQSYFLCEAKNGIGSGVSKVIFLKVNVPAHFEVRSKQVSVGKGKQVHMQCNVIGDTPMEIKWKIQSTQQYIDESTDARFSIREQSLDDGMVSELGISHTYRQDSGFYMCIASNAFGKDELMIQLVIQEVPEAPKNLRINSQLSRSIQISWNIPFSGNSPIDKYVVQYKPITDNWQDADKIIVAGTEIQATIANLKSAKVYQVRSTAENKFGPSEFSEIIQVTTLEEAPSGPPTSVKTETRSSTEIYVSWEAPEKDLWNGNLLGYYVGYQIVTNSKATEASTSNYSFKTVEVQSHFGGDVVLSGLNKFSKYKIVVQAYTAQGSGPTSKEIVVSTKEDGERDFN